MRLSRREVVPLLARPHFLIKEVVGCRRLFLAAGLFHCKSAVVDRRYLYTGSTNFTENSRRNEELCFKITDPVVHEVLEKLNCQKLKGYPWNG